MGKNGTSNAYMVPRLPNEAKGTQQGPHVSIQNQSGKKPAKWDRTGTIVETRDCDKYVIKVDGSGRLTLRNRRYLRKLFQDVGLYGSNTQKKVNQTTQAAENDTPPAVERLLAEPIPTTHQPLPTHWPLTTQPPPMLLQEKCSETTPNYNERTGHF